MKVVSLLVFCGVVTLISYYGFRRSARRPKVSKFALLYPCLAAAYIGADSRVPVAAMLAYGIANAGYMLLVAGIVSGRFSAFGLNKRVPTIFAGLACAVVGIAITTFATMGEPNG